jgi:pimeloyl-ACP methyl ester carboxylesterase
MDSSPDSREPEAPPQVPRTWQLPAGVKTASVNGYEAAYVERGAGVPVIFVHGAASDYRYFSAQMAPTSESYRAISVSLRRYFPEPWRGDGEFSLVQHAADLAAFIKQLDAGPVHLVGHSRGGTVALYATRAAAEFVRSLTFAEGGTSMKAFDAEDPAALDPGADWRRVVRQKLANGDVEGALEHFQTRINGPGAWQAAPESVRQSLRDNAYTLPAMFDDQANWPPFTCEDALALDVPVLLLEGEQSPPRFKRILDNVQQCLRHAERRVIPNSAHSMPRLNPAGFTSEVLAFMARH